MQRLDKEKQVTDFPDVFGSAEERFCSFQSGGLLYGINILHVREVIAEPEFFQIHHASELIKGVMNIRGQIHLIIDFRTVCGHTVPLENTDERVIIFKTSVTENLGILIDRIGEVIRVPADRIEICPREIASQGKTEYSASDIITHIGKLDSQLLHIIDVQNLAGHVRIQQQEM